MMPVARTVASRPFLWFSFFLLLFFLNQAIGKHTGSGGEPDICLCGVGEGGRAAGTPRLCC